MLLRRALTMEEREAIRPALRRALRAPAGLGEEALARTLVFGRWASLAEVRGPRSLLAYLALRSRADGIALGARVFVRQELVSPGGAVPLGLLAHEVAHVAQYLRDGTAPFLARYLAEYARNRAQGMGDREAYLAISYEEEARRVAAVITGPVGLPSRPAQRPASQRR